MTERQRTFFDGEFEADMEAKRHARRSDPETSHQAAAEIVQSGNLGRQCREILAHIKGRWASSAELADIALKYTSRISDLRHHGYDIKTRNSAAGWWYYRWDPPAEDEPCSSSSDSP